MEVIEIESFDIHNFKNIVLNEKERNNTICKNYISNTIQKLNTNFKTILVEANVSSSSYPNYNNDSTDTLSLIFKNLEIYFQDKDFIDLCFKYVRINY